MAIKLKKPAGTATIDKSVVDNKAKTIIAEETVEQKVEMPVAEPNFAAGQLMELQEAEPWCEIAVDASFTKNLGNYQSAKVGVSLKMPVKPGDLDEAFVFTRDWVNVKLESLIVDLG